MLVRVLLPLFMVFVLVERLLIIQQVRFAAAGLIKRSHEAEPTNV
jgi:hypothetical protein